MEVVKKFVDPTVIEFAEALLERARAGEIACVTALEERTLDGGYQIIGSGTNNRHRTAGMLMDAALNILGYRRA